MIFLLHITLQLTMIVSQLLEGINLSKIKRSDSLTTFQNFRCLSYNEISC